LVHNFKHSSLYLAVSVSKSSTTDGVDLIEEDNARFLRSRELENLSDHASTLTHISLYKL
jgi:hypothetical protein